MKPAQILALVGSLCILISIWLADPNSRAFLIGGVGVILIIAAGAMSLED